MTKSLVIFDLDGTLLNTIDDLGAAVNFALTCHGYATHSSAAYATMVGNGVAKLIERALPEDARKHEIIADMLVDFKEYYNCHLWDFTKPYPGIADLVERLTDEGMNLAVASNKYQEAVTEIIAHFFPKANFKAVFGQQEGVPRKPDPSIVFEVLTECPTPKAEVLYVGDSAVDVETARRACVDSCAVTWGFRPVRELRAACPDHIVGRPQEILRILEVD